MESFAQLICLVVVAVFCIVTHEVAHGYVALLNGDSTAQVNGRLTLNPVKHFDLIGFLMMIFCRIGYAKPVPINPYYFKNRRVGMITVSLAGITVNLLTSFIAVPLHMLVYKYCTGLLSGGAWGELLFYLLYYTTGFSVIFPINLALFNLLPFHPMDGYNFLENVLGIDNAVVRFLRDIGRYIIIVLVIVSFVARTFSLPNELNPLYWYIDTVGYWIRYAFERIWWFI